MIWFLHLLQFIVLNSNPFLFSVTGCIFLLQFLQSIVFSKMSVVRNQGFLLTSFGLVCMLVMCILYVYTLKRFWLKLF